MVRIRHLTDLFRHRVVLPSHLVYIQQAASFYFGTRILFA